MAAASLWLVACAASGGGVSFGDGGPSGAGGYVPTGGVANPDAATGGGPLSGGGTVSGGAGGTGAVGAAGSTGGMGSVAGTGVGSSSGGGAPPDAGPEAGPDASSGGTDGGAAYGDCCSVHSTPGCNVTAIKQCVCNIDATCCSLGWNLKCIQTATQYQCAACPDGGVPGSGGSGGTTSGGDCCFAKSTAGCSNPSVQACVCSVDSYCCQYSWDSLCASEVVSEGCGTC